MYNVTVLLTLLTFCTGSLQVVRVTEEFLAFYIPMAAMWCQFTVASCGVILGRTNLCTVCTAFQPYKESFSVTCVPSAGKIVNKDR